MLKKGTRGYNRGEIQPSCCLQLYEVCFCWNRFNLINRKDKSYDCRIVKRLAKLTQSKFKTPITRIVHYKFNCITVAVQRTCPACIEQSSTVLPCVQLELELELEWFIFQSKIKVYNQEKLLFEQILFHDFSVSCPFL